MSAAGAETRGTPLYALGWLVCVVATFVLPPGSAEPLPGAA
jgi:hypothetical protein